MGLDQYLYTNSKELSKRMAGFSERYHQWVIDKDCGYSKSGLIGYWRKENAIHNWFIENCQDGSDDQRTAQVSWSDLVMLRDFCNKVLETVKRDDNGKFVALDRMTAHEILPTREGFFFGTYEYDEWYVTGLEYTRDLINEIERNVNADDVYSVYCEDDPNWRVKFYYGCWW